jgi:hypothetical protein
LAVREPDTRWWDGLGLESPEALLKLFVRQSGCFTLVDRGKGFEWRNRNARWRPAAPCRAAPISARPGARRGLHPCARYRSKNGNAGGTNVGGMLGGLLGGFAGAVVANINISSKTADVLLTVTNVRTSEQQAMAEGHGSKTDVGFGGGLGGFGVGAFGAAGAGTYRTPPSARWSRLAYIDAYTKLVSDMGGLSENAKADAPQRTVTMARPGVMRASPE